MNKNLIMKEKTCNEDLLKLNDTEENILRQKAKIVWFRLGDGNNNFFLCFPENSE